MKNFKDQFGRKIGRSKFYEDKKKLRLINSPLISSEELQENGFLRCKRLRQSTNDSIDSSFDVQDQEPLNNPDRTDIDSSSSLNNQDNYLNNSNFNDIDSSFDVQDQEPLNNLDQTDIDSSSFNLNQTFSSVSSQNFSDKKLLCRKLFKIKLKNNLTKSAVKDILEFSNLARKLPTDLPKSVYKSEKIASFGKLSYKLGFNCLNCDNPSLISQNQKECLDCGVKFKFRSIFLKDNFFIFNLEEQLFHILNSYDLIFPSLNSSNGIFQISDGQVYKEYKIMKQNEQIITIQLFTDGFKVFQSQDTLLQAWPIFFKLNELDTKEDNKVFLYGCFIGYKKPNVEFFLKSLTEELNNLCETGINVQKSDLSVHPLALNCILDLPARAHFLSHTAHNGKYGCPTCTIKSQRSKKIRNKRIYRPTARRLYKSKKCYTVRLPYKGIFAKSKFNDISYVDAFEFCPADPMHATFIGFQKRLLKLMLKLKVSRFCSLKRKRNQIDERIKKFGYNPKFKRRFRTLSNVESYKAIEMFNWIFYLSPIVLRGLLNEDEYGFLMLFVYSLSILWNGASKSLIQSSHTLLRIFLEDVELFFGEDEMTINSHLHLHLKTSVLDFGPLKFNNAFLYESMNGTIKRLIRSSFGVSKQVLNQYNLMFFLNLDKKIADDDDLKLRCRFLEDDNVYFAKIVFEKKVFTCWSLDHNKSSMNCVVKLKNMNFIIIKSFHLEDDLEVYVKGWKLEVEGNLDFSYNDQNFELNYIYRCKILDNLVEFKFSEILHKVHLVREYDTLNFNSCYIIDIIHDVHN